MRGQITFEKIRATGWEYPVGLNAKTLVVDYIVVAGGGAGGGAHNSQLAGGGGGGASHLQPPRNRASEARYPCRSVRRGAGRGPGPPGPAGSVGGRRRARGLRLRDRSVADGQARQSGAGPAVRGAG